MSAERRGDLAESLHLVREDLRLHLIPQLKSDSARSQAAMMAELLDMVERELADPAATEALDAAIIAATHTLAPGQPESPEALEQAAAALGAQDDATDARRAIAAIAEADEVRLTGRRRTGHDSYTESGAGAKAVSEAAQAPFDAAALQTYLRSNGALYADVTVEGLKLLPGGFSKSTYQADLVLDGVATQWILRRDLAFSPLSSFVPDEYPLLTFIHSQGFPVPKALWCEPDPGKLGAATMAVSKIRGEGDMTAWSADAARAKAIGLKAAKLIADLHALDPATPAEAADRRAGRPRRHPRDPARAPARLLAGQADRA